MATKYGGYMGKIPSQISSAEKLWEEKHWHTGFLQIK